MIKIFSWNNNSKIYLGSVTKNVSSFNNLRINRFQHEEFSCLALYTMYYLGEHFEILCLDFRLYLIHFVIYMCAGMCMRW